MADDFSRAVKWGCGVYIGWAIGGLIVTIVSVGLIFLACGGCAMIGMKGISDGAKNQQARNESPGAESANSLRPMPRTEPSQIISTTTRQRSPAEIERENRQREAAEQERQREASERAKREADEQAAAEAKREADKKALVEKDAQTELDFAKRSADAGDKLGAAKRLRSLIQKYPATKAAGEAQKLLKALGG
jgi:hypothetical protein